MKSLQNRKTLFIFLLGFFLLILSSCSDQETGGDINALIQPNTPIVINAPFNIIINGEKVEIAEPWYYLRIRYTNTSLTHKINVATLTFTSVNIFTRKKTIHVPDQNEEAEFYFSLSPPPLNEFEIAYYIPSLPKPGEGESIDDSFFVYEVTLKLIGWYSDPNDPTDTPIDRYEQEFYFFTE